MAQGKRELGNVLDKLAAIKPTNHNLGIDLPKKAEVIPTNVAYDPKAICGYCFRVAEQHPITEFPNSVDNCKRSAEVVGSVTSYQPSTKVTTPAKFQHSNVELWEQLDKGHFVVEDLDRYGLPKVDYSGPELDYDYSADKFEKWDVVFDSADNLEAIQSYRDQNEVQFTKKPNPNFGKVDTSGEVDNRKVIDDKPIGGEFATAFPVGVGIDPEQPLPSLKELVIGANVPNTVRVQEPAKRNVFVEGHDGFMSLVINDENLNRLLQERMLNIYRQNGALRVGGIQFKACVDGSIDARCVQPKCGQVLNTGTTQSRTEMEDFTLNVIRHGNNHAALTIKNETDQINGKHILRKDQNNNLIPRADYYKVHAHYCDLTCDSNAPGCNYSSTRVPFAIPGSITAEMESEIRNFHITKALDEGVAELMYTVNNRRSA